MKLVGETDYVECFGQDFDSHHLKHKKHWNSFTGAFFIPLCRILSDLKQHGGVTINKPAMLELLKADLRCHRCNAPQRTMPALKAHIAACKDDVPA